MDFLSRYYCKNTKIGSHDYDRGIRGYTDGVFNCPVCNIKTNVFWENNRGEVVLACSKECADKRRVR